MTTHHQSEASECGLACLSIALEQLGAPIDLSELRRKHVISSRGLTVKELVDVAASLGLVGRAVRCELEELPDLQCPAVLHWGLNHFVVLEKVKGGYATIHDPDVGCTKFKIDHVSDQLTGVAIVDRKMTIMEYCMQFLRIGTLCIVGLVLSCLTPNDARATEVCGVEQAQSSSPKGMLFSITKKDTLFGYVFGSMHTGHSSMKDLPVKIRTALKNTSKIYFEKDMRLRADEVNAYADTMLSTFSKTLGSTLNSETKEKVIHFFKEHDLSDGLDEALAKMPVVSFVEGMLRDSSDSQKFGKNPSLDDMILKFGVEKKLPIGSLETFTDITQAMAKITNDEWSAYVFEALLAWEPNFKGSKTLKNDHASCLAAMVFEEDSNKLEAYLKKYYRSFPAEFAKDKHMVFSRNSNMAAVIKKSLSADEIIFVSIGATHVIGDDGVAQRLRNMGYKVEPVFE